jgi:tetratricopeptide (TPR) repeat protein
MKCHAIVAVACLLSWLARDAAALPRDIRQTGAQAPHPGAQIVLVFDLQDMSAASLQRARSAAETFVRSGLPNGVNVGIVADDRFVGGRLASNRDDLLAALASLRASGDALARQGAIPLDRSDARAAEIAATLDAATPPAADIETRARRTLATLDGLTKTLAPVPGRKTIVWISDSFSAPSREREKLGGQEAQVKSLLAAAAMASVRLVGVDARASLPALLRDDLWAVLIAGTGGQLVGSEKELAAALRNAVAETDGKPAGPPTAPPPPTLAAPAAPALPVPPAAEKVPAAAAPSAARVAPTRTSDAASLRESGPVDAGLLPADLLAQAHAGWEAYQAGDTKGARASLLATAAHPAAPPWVHYVLGWSEFAEGNIEAARTQWTSVRREVPAFQRVYFDLADCSLRQQRPADALSTLNDAARRWPNSTEVLNAIGAVQASVARLNEALEAFEGAVAREPEDSTAHFNIARTLELRYVRDAQPVRGSSGKPSAADLERAASEYRRVFDLRGAEAPDAVEGLRRTSEIDVKTLRPGAPALIGSFVESALGGLPARLAWSADGTYLCIGSLQMDNRGKVVARAVRIVTAWSGEVNAATAAPDWAESYWAWKSAPNPAWIPGLKIESGRQRSYSMYSMGAPTSTFVTTYQLGSEVVGESTEELPFSQGTSYSWSPYAMGALAYVDKRGVLAVLDKRGRKLDLVGGRGLILLPAWSPDGVSIAYLEKGGKGFDLKLVEVYPKR